MTALVLAACESLQKKEETESYEYVLTFFVPEDATIVSHIDDFLLLNSTQSLSELIEFYENAFLRLLDVNESEIDDTRDGIWIFSGVYNGIHIHQKAPGFDEEDYRERPFIVELRDNGESIDIEIIY
jgi:hypothetical protein